MAPSLSIPPPFVVTRFPLILLLTPELAANAPIVLDLTKYEKDPKDEIIAMAEKLTSDLTIPFTLPAQEETEKPKSDASNPKDEGMTLKKEMLGTFPAEVAG